MATPRKRAAGLASAGPLVFRDTLYTSRVLILADGRQLCVVQGCVSADAADDTALDYLSKHPDLQPQE
nr:hypothetical protein FFPRI1PSEUD_14690 [Pseudomonas sp. FFPRI_1]